MVQGFIDLGHEFCAMIYDDFCGLWILGTPGLFEDIHDCVIKIISNLGIFKPASNRLGNED